jgi:hypothetical protein
MARRVGLRGVFCFALLVAGCAGAQAHEPGAVDAPNAATLTSASPGGAVAEPDGLYLDQDDGDDAPPGMGQMTEEAARGKHLFDNARWEQASLMLKRAADGETGDDEGNRELAQYRIAIALFNMKLFQTSYAIFSDIAAKSKHVKHSESLLWLARLAVLMPEPADVVGRVGKYSQEELTRFGSSDRRELLAQLNTMLGRYHVRNRNYEPAATVLAEVDAKSKFFVRAQLALGAAEHGQRKPARAAAAFERAAAAIGSGALSAEDARMRNLARLLRGSALYAAALSTDSASVVKVDAKLLATAVMAWQQVDPDSEYWLDAALETAAAHIVAGNYTNAASTLRWLSAAGVPTTVDIDVDSLSAAVAFRTCRYGEADAAAAKIASKYDPVLNTLDALLARPALVGDDAERGFFELASQLRAGGATVAASIRPLLDEAVSDRMFLSELDYLRFLAAEEARFKQSPASFRSSMLGADVADVLALSQEIAMRDAGRLALDRVLGSRDGLNAKRSPLLTAISTATKPNGDKQAAQAQIALILSQPRARHLLATPELNGRGRKPAAPKTAPPETAVTSKCAP